MGYFRAQISHSKPLVFSIRHVKAKANCEATEDALFNFIKSHWSGYTIDAYFKGSFQLIHLFMRQGYGFD